MTSQRKSDKHLQPSDSLQIPPHSIEIERSIVGMMLLNDTQDIIEPVMDRINEDYFYSDDYRTIFNHIKICHAQKRRIDILGIYESIKRSGELDKIGGVSTLVKATEDIKSTTSIDTHCDFLEDDYIGRELIKAGHSIQQSGYDQSINPIEKLDNAEKALSKIANRKNSKNYTTISETTVDVLKKVYFLKEQGKQITGVPSGHTCVDITTHGWQPTDLIILAARPSVGKTSFALNLARNAAYSGVPVGFFSLEMSAEQLTQRLLAAESSVYLSSIKTGNISDKYLNKLTEYAGKLADAPIFIDETPGLNIFELRSKARRMKIKHNVGLIIIDYLQLMNGVNENRNSNREQEISRISRDLKGLAKELKIPIIALSQLSREVEKRGDKTPQLSDLRESGAIEQDADIVMFLYRMGEGEIKLSEGEYAAALKFSKHRNGSLKDIIFSVRGDFQQWNETKEQPDFPDFKRFFNELRKRP